MSDLLNQASLVMIPSGYKEDVVYSQIPTDGSGDLSFTRASNGTRINSAGLVEVAPCNLADQSNTFGTSPWSNVLDTGATLTYTANYGTAPDGTTTAGRLQMALNGSNYAQKNQIISVITGQQYTYSVWIKSLSGTKDVIFCYDNTNNIHATVTTEWQRFTHTFTGNSQVYARFVLEAGTSTSVDLLIYGAQLNIGSTAKPYFPTTDRLNVPRLTYQNGGGGCPSLLLEKQSTNLLKYSEQFDDSNWTKDGATITANTTISPDGTQNADTLTGASGNYRIYQIVGGLSSIDYTFSVFAKKGTANLIWLDFINVGDGPSFNFTTKAWSSASGWVTSYEEHANGWFRLIATKASNTTSAGLGIKVGAVNETVYLWGAQMEASSYKTSYIGTTSSSATRVADACYKTGISSLIGQTEGTMFVQVTAKYKSADIASINTGATNAVYIVKTSNNYYRAVIYAGGVSVVTITQGTVIETSAKIAVVYKSGSTSLFINGSKIQTNTTTYTFTTALNSFYFQPNYLIGLETNEVQQSCLFPTALTDAECISLTS